jgi:hypothetical protein
MNTVNLLMCSWGEVECPPDKWPTTRIRKDGKTDQRYKAGRAWWKWFMRCEREGRLV